MRLTSCAAVTAAATLVSASAHHYHSFTNEWTPVPGDDGRGGITDQKPLMQDRPGETEEGLNSLLQGVLDLESLGLSGGDKIDVDFHGPQSCVACEVRSPPPPFPYWSLKKGLEELIKAH